eukprot:CAMPEP_0194514096 /NCGR_PEP_ID=MMETSP0253-20130528/46464_1 /TAXON_ID=2966 /ORGANISM="Noctiluca scintillans" /LENGTH=154 /DNA_ID=CAMNT_0039357711 /DNA_START=30 /DNA_END=494 /DNA_ORIENTATION=-
MAPCVFSHLAPTMRSLEATGQPPESLVRTQQQDVQAAKQLGSIRAETMPKELVDPQTKTVLIMTHDRAKEGGLDNNSAQLISKLKAWARRGDIVFPYWLLITVVGVFLLILFVVSVMRVASWPRRYNNHWHPEEATYKGGPREGFRGSKDLYQG